jgi:hypothetical protein
VSFEGLLEELVELKGLKIDRNRPYYSDVTGPDMGLIIVLNNSADDYFYNIVNSIGSSVSGFKVEQTYQPRLLYLSPSVSVFEASFSLQFN